MKKLLTYVFLLLLALSFNGIEVDAKGDEPLKNIVRYKLKSKEDFEKEVKLKLKTDKLKRESYYVTNEGVVKYISDDFGDDGYSFPNPTSTSSAPYSASGAVVASYLVGSTIHDYICSGTIVADDVALSVAHCVYDVPELGSGFPDYVTVYPRRDLSTLSGGTFDVTEISIHSTYKDNIDRSSVTYDYTVLKLDVPVGSSVSVANLDTTVSLNEFTRLVGYPGNYTDYDMRYSTGSIESIYTVKKQLTISNHAVPGFSGGGVFDSQNDLIGILVGGTSTSTFVRQLSSDIVSLINTVKN